MINKNGNSLNTQTELQVKDSLNNIELPPETLTSLKNLAESGKLDLVIRDVSMEMTKKKILEEHPYSIWQGKDGRWRTKVKTETGWLQLKKTKKADLEKAIVDFYIDADEKCTLASFYLEWMKYKIRETSRGNGNKLIWVWNKYYKDSELVNIEVSQLTTKKIKQWLLEMVDKHQLDRTHYREMKSVINMMLDYAVEEEFVLHNFAREIRNISDNHFYEKEEKTYDEQVFRMEIIDDLIRLCFKQFDKTKNPSYLGIVLNFNLGLRVGELVALKPTDFDFQNHILRVRRMEKAKYIEEYTAKDVKMQRNGYEFVNHAKSTDGKRPITLTPAAESIVHLIMRFNAEMGYGSEWLFYSKSSRERLHNDGINNVLRRVNEKLDTIQKPNHAIRKTTLSQLFKNGFTEDEVRQFAGHHETLTTHKYYEFAEANSADNRSAYTEAFHSDALDSLLKESGTQVEPKNPE